MPSTGDVSDPSRPPGAAPLLTAVRQLAERNVYGLVWIGSDLVVESTYGPLVEFIPLAEPITSSVYVLVGMEAEIEALRSRPGDALELPDITLVTPEGRRPRATLSISWSPDDGAYLLLVARTESRSDLELELTAQMRARLMAESELAAKTRELERANADLEAYASIISHDLQSPMRLLRYTIDDLEAELGAPPAPIAAKFGKLRDLSRRMTAMLSALLDYASIGRKSEALESIDTALLIKTVVASLDVPSAMRVEVTGSWPRVKTLAAPLDLVLRNLVDNAVKHHDRKTGLITIAAEGEDGALRLTVSDDGPGIPPDARDAAFLPFRRLNDDSGVPGQGMGLALVRRTIETAGGKIALHSQAPQSRGSTFIIHWPVR